MKKTPIIIVTAALTLTGVVTTMNLLAGGKVTPWNEASENTATPAWHPAIGVVEAPSRLSDETIEDKVRELLPPTFEPHPFSRSINVRPADYHFTFAPKDFSLRLVADDGEAAHNWRAFSIHRSAGQKSSKAAETVSEAPTFLYAVGSFQPETGMIRLLDPLSGQLVDLTATAGTETLLGMVR